MCDAVSSAPSRGPCVFCDRPIPLSDPPEHVIPTWMKRFRPKDAAFTGRLGIVTDGELRGTFTQPSPLSMRPDVTTDAVCRQCNGGWMSDLETRASQLLPSMIAGERRGLTPDDHAFLAVWATKTVMTWQTTNQQARPIPLADYRWLRTQLTPPPLTLVQLGQFVGTAFPYFGYCQAHLWRGGAPDVPEHATSDLTPHAHREALTIGPLLFEVFGSCDGIPVTHRFPDLPGDVMLDIWPGIGPSIWPPRLAFNDARLFRFLELPAGSLADIIGDDIANPD